MTTRNGVVLTMETGAAGSWEDGRNQTWTAEAYRNGNPIAEGSGDTPLDAAMALAQALCNKVNDEAVEYRIAAVEDAQAVALAELTPGERAEVERNRARIEQKRAAARREDLAAKAAERPTPEF